MRSLLRRFKEKKEERPSGCVVWDRAQLVEYVAKNVGFDAIGDVVGFVERVMVMQNDIGRPTYVVEVDASIGRDGISVIADAMTRAGVSCILVPAKTVDCVAQLAPESMGVENGGVYSGMMQSARNAAVAVETIERQVKEG